MGEWEREAGFETWQKYEVTRHVQFDFMYECTIILFDYCT